MYKKAILFFVLILWGNFVFARQHFLYDYTEVITPVSGGVISFRLIGSNFEEDEPKRVRYRSKPYFLSIRYIAEVPFVYAVISNLKFSNIDSEQVIFERNNQRSELLGASDKQVGYASFNYGDLSEPSVQEYVDYVVTGVLSICYLDDKCEEHKFKTVMKRDYKKKWTWDFWEGIMGI
jgi:hypothetical protein